MRGSFPTPKHSRNSPCSTFLQMPSARTSACVTVLESTSQKRWVERHGEDACCRLRLGDRLAEQTRSGARLQYILAWLDVGQLDHARGEVGGSREELRCSDHVDACFGVCRMAAMVSPRTGRLSAPFSSGASVGSDARLRRWWASPRGRSRFRPRSQSTRPMPSSRRPPRARHDAGQLVERDRAGEVLVAAVAQKQRPC